MSNIVRCDWCNSDEIYINYHDNEWGKINKDDRYLFEMLCLEGAQAGLSWLTILKRRDAYRELFYNFDYNLVANMQDQELNLLILNEKIIRNKLKIYGFRKNAVGFKKIVEEYGSFNNYLWKYVNNNQIINQYSSIKELPSKSVLSDTISKDLKKRGFTFVGSIIIYSFLQAVGIIDDHLTQCSFKSKENK